MWHSKYEGDVGGGGGGGGGGGWVCVWGGVGWAVGGGWWGGGVVEARRVWWLGSSCVFKVWPMNTLLNSISLNVKFFKEANFYTPDHKNQCIELGIVL